MKTTDNGGTFNALTDKQDFASTGAVAVAPSDPKVVWLGHRRGQRSQQLRLGHRRLPLDRRRHHMGARRACAAPRRLPGSWCIPSDPATAYVAAVGDLWTDSAERGLFKTTDGGQSWKPVLQAPAPDNVTTGCGEVALDPQNPDTVYAVLYARRRTPWSFEAGVDVTKGRDVGGIYRSTDAGATWKKLAGGLPVADRPHRALAVREEPQGDLRGRAEQRGRHAEHRRGGQQAGRRLPLRGRRRHLDAHEPAQPAPVLLQPDPRRPAGRPPRVRPRLHAARLGGRRQDLPRGSLRQGASRHARSRHRPAQPEADAARHRRRRVPDATTARRRGRT